MATFRLPKDFFEAKKPTFSDFIESKEQKDEIEANMPYIEGKKRKISPKKTKKPLFSIDVTTIGLIKDQGDVVLLCTDRHGIDKNNPHFKSKYACNGVVTSANSTGVLVQWSNGTHNTYTHRDLAFPKTVKYSRNPNRSFLLKKKRPRIGKSIRRLE
jgi:hypothetical protein